MRCSTRKAPMGTMPVSECNLRNRNELPSPARSDGTPLATSKVRLLIGLADEATTPTPYDSQSIKTNLALSNSQTAQVKNRNKCIDLRDIVTRYASTRNDNPLGLNPGSIVSALRRG